MARSVALQPILDSARGLTGRPLRFVLAGGVNTVVGLAIYPLLLWLFPLLRTHYMSALGISQVLCVLFAFSTYKVTVFKSRGNVLNEFLRFASFYAANYAVNWVALPLLVEVARIPPAIAQVGFSLVVMITSYFWHSRITFRDIEHD